MDRETIIYNGQKYHRYPKSKRRQFRVYYWKHDKQYAPPVALHRQIWIDNFGPIPEKYIVNHKDGNSLNNDVSNLGLLTRSEHMSMHASEPERRKKSKENIKKAIGAAKVWHRSEEGRKWHRKHWKTSLGKIYGIH